MALELALEFRRARKTRCLPRDELTRLQTRKLREILRFASQRVPYYHDLIRTLAKSPDDFGTPASLRGFPILTKTDLGRRASSLKASGVRAYTVVNTSGTTGRPTTIVYSAEATRVSTVLSLRDLMLAGVRRRTKFVTVWPPISTWRTVPTPDGGTRPMTPLQQVPSAKYLRYIAPGVSHLWSNTSDPAADATALAEKDPEFILCTPSRMRRIASTGRDEELRRIRPRRIFLGSEIFTQATRDYIERTFETQTLNTYAATEVGALGMECGSGRGIHAHEDYLIYEVLKDGEQVGPGEVGELTVTVLHNYAMPLIRYATGDLVRRADDDGARCECGASVMRLSEVCGRCIDGIVAHDGSRIPPVRVAEVVESVLGPIDYQVVQDEVGHLQVKVLEGETVDSRAVDELGERLGEILGAAPRVTIARATREDFAAKNRVVICAIESSLAPRLAAS